MDSTFHGNYDSGEDFVLEYGDLRFTFNERDFSERCEQAASRLGFVHDRLDRDEVDDLVELTVAGEVAHPVSRLGEHVNECWTELSGPAERSLVHWMRRLVFRGAWMDQRVKEGDLDVRYDEDQQRFEYVQPTRDDEPVQLAPAPSWFQVSYSPVDDRR